MVTWFSRLIIIALLCAVPFGAMAQSPPPAAAPTQPLLKAPELDQLVAPIALHPDPLLSEILIAATYPLEVVQADRWAKSNKTLKGDALTGAIAKQSWDESVKSLVQVPTVLSMMAEQLDWTQMLGDAVLAQQPDVMDAIQRLRTRAQSNGKLKSTKEQTVTVKTEDAKQYVVIEPTSPTEIYVPYYEPAVVYGDWPYPDYAPYYFPPPYGYFTGGALAAGIAFAAGVAIRHAYWGNCDWGRRNINVASNRSVDINNINRSRWEHNVDHRHGVKYNNADVRQKFAKTDVQAGRQARQDFRGKDGQKVLDPNRDRPGAGDRPAAGDRPGAGDRPRDRHSACSRSRQGGPATEPATSQKAAQRPAQQPKAAQRPAQQAKAAQRPAQQPKAAQRPSQPRRDSRFFGGPIGGQGSAPSQPRTPKRGGGGAPRAARGSGGRRSDIAPQARNRAAWPPRQRPWLLSFQLCW